ncbi:MAG: hypothetical protein NVS2B7_15060 [Herpetosiphon sp.]
MYVKRASVWLIIVLLVLAGDYRLQRDYFGTVGDVQLYHWYADRLFESPPQLPEEYPPLAAVVFAVPRLVAPDDYLLVFTLLSALASAAIVILVDRESGRGGRLLSYMAISGFATLFFRFDSFVVLVTVGAFLLAQRRRWVAAQLLLAVGVGLKLYPVLLMPLVTLAAWHSPTPKARREAVLSAVAGAAGLLAVLLPMVVLARPQLLHMLRYHAERPLQTESVGATLAWVVGPTGTIFSFGSANITSAAGGTIIQLLTVATVLGLSGVYLLFARRRVPVAAAWALVMLVAISTSKVFSTQYLLWALPFVVLAGERRALWLAVAVATAAVYPFAFVQFQPFLGEPTIPWWFALTVAVRNGVWLLACGVELWTWLQGARTTELVTPRRPVAGAA